jgi:hypothetical protein
MKVNIFLASALFLATCLTTQAQLADVTWGDATKLNTKSVNTGIFSDEAEYIYSTRTGPAEYGFSSIFVDKVNKKQLNTESSFEIYSPTLYSTDGKTQRVFQFNEVVHTQDGGFLVFFTEPDYVKYSFTSHCQKFDKDGKKVGALVQLQIFQGHEKTVIGRFIVIRSPLNDGFFLMYSRPFIQYDNEYLVFDFYDYNLEKKWERKQKFPLNGKEFEPRQYKTNIEDSTLYLVVRVLEETEEERAKKGNTKVNYSFALLDFKFDPNDTNSTFNSTPIHLQKKYISDISFEVTNHELVFAGFYADKKTMEASGAFCIVLEEYSKKVRSNHHIEFEKGFHDKFMEPGNEKYGKQAMGRGDGIRDFQMRDLQIANDGSIYVIAENVFAAFKAGKVRGFTEIIYSPYYNNVVVTKIGNDRKVGWISTVVKRQIQPTYSTNEFSGFTLSYTYAIYGDKVVIIYNDLESNVKAQSPLELKYVSSSKGTVPVLATINSKGEVSRDILFDGDDKKVILCPKTSVVENKSMVYMYTILGSTQRWGLLKFY